MEQSTAASTNSSSSSGRFDLDSASHTSSSQRSQRSLDTSSESIENLHHRLTKVEKKRSKSKFSSMIMTPGKLLRRFASSPTIKVNPDRKLYRDSVKEREDAAFNRQLAMLEDPPEWDLNAGIGNEEFETPALTPPPVTTSRATSPSRVGRVAESSKKGLQRLIAIVLEGPASNSSEEVKYNKKSRATKSLPDLLMSGGKGRAASITDSPPMQESRGRGRNPKPVDDRHRGHYHFPHSWRIPPESTLGNTPHIRNSVPPAGFPFGPVDSVKDREYTVLARVMWKNGEIRFSDQYNRRLIPVGRQDSFVFELWPVAEGDEIEDAPSSLSSTPIFEEPEEMTEEERAAWSTK